MGVPPTTMLFTAPYKGPTPNKIYRAQIITTGDLVSLLKKDKNLILVDTSGLKDTLPIGYSLPDAGSDGSVTDGLQADLDAWLMKKTGGKRDQPIVFLGAGMNDRSSCGAARRHAGLDRLLVSRRRRDLGGLRPADHLDHAAQEPVIRRRRRAASAHAQQKCRCQVFCANHAGLETVYGTVR